MEPEPASLVLPSGSFEALVSFYAIQFPSFPSLMLPLARCFHSSLTPHPKTMIRGVLVTVQTVKTAKWPRKPRIAVGVATYLPVATYLAW